MKNDTILRLLEEAHEALVDASNMAPGKYWEPGDKGWQVDQEILELLKGEADAELV